MLINNTPAAAQRKRESLTVGEMLEKRMKEKNRKLKETKLVERNLVTFLFFSLSFCVVFFFFFFSFHFAFILCLFPLNLSLNVVRRAVEGYIAKRTRVERESSPLSSSFIICRRRRRRRRRKSIGFLDVGRRCCPNQI